MDVKIEFQENGQWNVLENMKYCLCMLFWSDFFNYQDSFRNKKLHKYCSLKIQTRTNRQCRSKWKKLKGKNRSYYAMLTNLIQKCNIQRVQQENFEELLDLLSKIEIEIEKLTQKYLLKEEKDFLKKKIGVKKYKILLQNDIPRTTSQESLLSQNDKKNISINENKKPQNSNSMDESQWIKFFDPFICDDQRNNDKNMIEMELDDIFDFNGISQLKQRI